MTQKPSSYPEPDDAPQVPVEDSPIPADSQVPAVVEDTPQEHVPAQHEPEKVKGSIAGSTWVALILGILLLILLLVFILQNQQQVEVHLFAWTWEFPAGVAYLLSAIIGALIMALVGGWRIIELRRQVRKANK